MSREFMISTTVVFVLGATLAAQEASQHSIQPGEFVVIGKPSVELLVEQKAVGELNRGELLQISLVNGEWLFVWQEQGWLHRDDVWDLEEAEKKLTAEMETDPSPTLLQHRGAARLAAGLLEEAIADFDAALELEPENAAILNNRGSAYQKQQNLRQALADFTKAIELSPDVAVFWVNRSAAWAESGDSERALSDAQKAVEIDPENALALNNRGVSWFENGNFDSALADYNEALKLTPHFAEAYVNRAAVLKRQERFEQARRDFEAAIMFGARSASAKNDYAWFLCTCTDEEFRNIERAIVLAEEACQLTNQEDWNMLDTLAVAYAEGSRIEEAVATLELAIEQAPEAEKAALRQKLKLFRQQQ